MTTTQSTIKFEPGSVVRVRIRFTAGEGAKRRPAVILTDTPYHQSRSDAIVVALSSQMTSHYFGDCALNDWKAAGLPVPTKAKGVIETIDRNVVDYQYGTLSPADLQTVRQSMKQILGV